MNDDKNTKLTKIKVVYFDDEPIVYKDGNRLNKKEIVDLLVEYFEDCDTLINENEELKNRIDNYNTALKKLQDLTEKKINENEQLKQELFEVSKELLLETSSEIDRILYCEDEIEELRKEIFK